jgi:mRNA-degrading endonuclease RelE of RelBE toxin-antitoxin system
VKVEFTRSFEKDLESVRDGKTLQRVDRLIAEVRDADRLSDIRGIKKLTTTRRFYRIRVGGHRVGVEIVGDTIWLLRCLPRKTIYRAFPPR